MKISLNWIKQYIPALDAEPEELERVFPMIGFEVDSVQHIGLPPLENLVVGEILSREQHPNADRLGVCTVKVHPEQAPVQIVCGATNYKVGDRVPVALVGCVLPGNFKIKESKLRGVESFGMMCSAKELGLGEDHSGLMILDGEPGIGKPMNDVFKENDVMFELELTANRGDCWCHIGLARELAAYYGIDLEVPALLTAASYEAQATSDNQFLKSVEVQSEDCALYTAWTIRGVNIAPSPEWLKAALIRVDLRPINNVVDVTNYVMLEGGQPLHAFDAAKIRGSRIIVRQANDGEKITTLDDKERTLSSDMLVIADETTPMVVAGVMGSVTAEVADYTRDIVLESAWFKPGAIRRTARRLALHTDSSNRFARDVDPNGVDFWARRAIDLIKQVAGGEVVGPCVRVGDLPRTDRTISITPEYIEQVCGFPVEDEEVESTFQDLGFSVEADEDDWRVQVPSFRSEVDRPIDLVEEFIRHHGTKNIPASRVETVGLHREDDALSLFNTAAVDYLVGEHFNECIHYSLTNEAAVSMSFEPADALKLANPLSQEHSHVRASLLPGLLKALSSNLNNGNYAGRLCETGSVFRADEAGRVFELASVAFVMAQPEGERFWKQPEAPDFFAAKGVLENLAELAGLPERTYRTIEGSILWQQDHSAAAGCWVKDGWMLKVGVVNVKTATEQDLPAITLVAELFIKPELLRAKHRIVRFKPFVSLPAVSRDLALVVPADTLADTVRIDMLRAAEAAVGELAEVESVNVFDIYTGEGVAEGKKSLALEMAFRPIGETLKDKQINQIFEGVQKTLRDSHQYEIRA